MICKAIRIFYLYSLFRILSIQLSGEIFVAQRQYVDRGRQAVVYSNPKKFCAPLINSGGQCRTDMNMHF